MRWLLIKMKDIEAYQWWKINKYLDNASTVFHDMSLSLDSNLNGRCSQWLPFVLFLPTGAQRPGNLFQRPIHCTYRYRLLCLVWTYVHATRIHIVVSCWPPWLQSGERQTGEAHCFWIRNHQGRFLFGAMIQHDSTIWRWPYMTVWILMTFPWHKPTTRIKNLHTLIHRA